MRESRYSTGLTPRPPRRHRRARAGLLLLALLPLTGLAQSNYAAFELKRDNNFDPLLIHDMNGDNLKDVIVSGYNPGIGREVLIYLQQENGQFQANPLRVEIKTEIIAVGFADLRPEPGMELVLLASNGAFSLNPRQAGYAGNIKQLVEWDLIASMPDPEEVRFFDGIYDLDRDSHADLVLPGIESYGIFHGLGDEQFAPPIILSTINESTAAMERSNPRNRLDARMSINAEEGIVLQVSSRARTPFSDFVELWQEEADTAGNLLESERWMPALLTAQLNADDLLDVAYLNVGADQLGQINIHLQQPDGSFAAQPDWFGSIDTRGSLRFTDINHDGLLDLLRLRGEGDEWTAQLFLNAGGRFDLDQPSQVMRFSGYDARLNFLQLEPGAEPVLNVSYYTIPVVDAIRNASVNRIQLLYGHDPGEPDLLFARRPDFRLEESFSAANVRGLSEQMSLRYDVDGDGRNDALYITENGTLAAKHIENNLAIATEPFWEYVSSRTVFEFEVIALNADERPDLLLRHGTSTTLLVARP